MCRLRIRDLREDRDLSQAEIAKIINCTQTCYSKYELEQRDIPTKTLIELSNYYNVSVDYLLGKTKDPTPPSEHEQRKSKEEEKAPAKPSFTEAINAMFLERKGREPNQQELLILKKFAETFIDGMNK